MAEAIRDAFRKGLEEFQQELLLQDCVTVNYCTHISVYTRNGLFVIELDY